MRRSSNSSISRILPTITQSLSNKTRAIDRAKGKDMRVKFLASILLIIGVAAISRAAGDEAPPWLQQLAKQPVPAYDKDVPAVVLQDEQRVTVSEDGKITT